MLIRRSINIAVRAFSIQNFNKELVKLSVVFRHGDRMPVLQDMPIDKYKNIKFNLPPESLTPNGAERAKNLGRKLRKQYQHFFGPYNPVEVDAISSGYQRCKDTLLNMSKGLYNQEIAYHSPPLTEDYLIATFHSTPEMMGTKAYEITDSEDVKFYNKIYKHTGKQITNYRDGLLLQDFFKVMKEIGHDTPDWVDEYWDEFNMQYLKFWSRVGQTYAQLGAGNLLRKIASDSANVVSNPNPKVHIYSGHDFNIVLLLHLFDYFKVNNINYCSCLAFEVYKPINGSHYIQIFFDNFDDNERIPLEIPGFGYKCTLSDFLMFATKFTKEKQVHKQNV